MNPYVKFAAITFAIFIIGSTEYFQAHRNEYVTGYIFWISFLLAGLAPVGTYILGLFQNNPFGKKD